jgi:phage shock protein PspC (stress-responsive transcriptional regulator)
MDRLYRSRDDRMLAGVAGGLAELWGADPSLVRVIWALLVLFTGGVAFIVYIVMAIVIPEEPDVPLPVDGQAVAAAGEAAPTAGQGWASATDARAARRAAREARAVARRAAGGDRSGFPAGAILGGFLIILGGFFLAREFLPQIDFDWFWPLVLVGLGVLLVVSAVRRPSDSA